MMSIAFLLALGLTASPSSPLAETVVAEPPQMYILGGSERLSQPCIGILNSYECAQAIEHTYLQEHSTGVMRVGHQLSLPLQSGEMLTLVDASEHEAEYEAEYEGEGWYSYMEYIESINSHLVHLQYYEGDAFLLVNANTGIQTLIDTVPVVSPDRTHFVTASASEAYNPNRVQIWRVTEAAAELEWEYEPTDWGPINPQWVSSTQVTVEAMPMEFMMREPSDPNAPLTQIAIEQRSNAWSLQ
jgi:hypothetical protein